MKVGGIVLIIALTTACNGRSVQPASATATVIAARDQALPELRTVPAWLRAWAATALRRPGSAAYVISAGKDRHRAVTAFAAVVPRSWAGGNVLAAKSAWITRVHELAAAAESTSFSAAVEIPDSDATLEAVRIVPSVNSLGEPWEFTAHEPNHLALVCDVSESADSCDVTALTRAYDTWLMKGTAPRSSFEVWLVGRSISDARRVFSIQTPAGHLRDRVAFLLGGRNELSVPELLHSGSSHIGSAVSETMAVAVRSLREKSGALSLYLLSDMRQLTPGEIDLEQGSMPSPKAFAGWLTAHRLMLDLSNVDVTVCGVHHRVRQKVPPWPTRRLPDLSELWLATLRSMHARTIKICGACDATAFTATTNDQRRSG